MVLRGINLVKLPAKGKRIAVHATVTRLMIEPRKIRCLEEARDLLANVAYKNIEQIGERFDRFQTNSGVTANVGYGMVRTYRRLTRIE